MNLYLDTSSLLKLFLIEEGTTTVRDTVGAAQMKATSSVSLAEGRGSLARATRGYRLAADLYPAADAAFQELVDGLRLIEPSHSVTAHAGDLAARYFLRGLDAVHLASALALQEGLGETVSLSSFDSRLNEAAADCGLAVV